MTRDRRNINTVRDLMAAHETYHKAKKVYDGLRKEVDEMTGNETTTYGLYTVTYIDATTSGTDWEAIAEALGITAKEAKERFTTKTATKRFKGVTSK